MKETSLNSSNETKDNNNSYSRIGVSGGTDSKQENDSTMDSELNKKLSAEALQKEDDDFAKLEEIFITELGLTSTELPSYAKAKGVDVAPAEPESKPLGKGR